MGCFSFALDTLMNVITRCVTQEKKKKKKKSKPGVLCYRLRKMIVASAPPLAKLWREGQNVCGEGGGDYAFERVLATTILHTASLTENNGGMRKLHMCRIRPKRILICACHIIFLRTLRSFHVLRVLRTLLPFFVFFFFFSFREKSTRKTRLNPVGGFHT